MDRMTKPKIARFIHFIDFKFSATSNVTPRPFNKYIRSSCVRTQCHTLSEIWSNYGDVALLKAYINQMVPKPYHLLMVNSLKENWPIEREFSDFGLKAGQQLHFKRGAEAGNSGGNRLAERQLPIE